MLGALYTHPVKAELEYALESPPPQGLYGGDEDEGEGDGGTQDRYDTVFVFCSCSF